MLGLEQKGVTSRRDIGADDGQPMQGDILEVIRRMRPRKRSSGPTRRGCIFASFSIRIPRAAATFLNCLYTTRRSTRMSRVCSGVKLQLVIELDWLDDLLGQKRGCLDLQQRGRDDEEVTRDIEIEVLHAFDLGKILIGDNRRWRSPDVDLLTRDEREQQVEWSLICIYADAI